MSGNIESYRVREQVGFLLRLAHQRVSWIFSKKIKPENLTPPQFNTLALIHELGPQSQAELSSHSAMDAMTLQGVAVRLQRRGLILRSRDTKDRRRWILDLTDEGRTIFETAQSKAREITADFLLPLKPDERKIFLRLLRKLT